MNLRVALLSVLGLCVAASSASAEKPLWQEPSEKAQQKLPRCHSMPIKGVTIRGGFAHDRGCKLDSILVGKRSYKDVKRATAAAMRRLSWSKRTVEQRKKLAEMWTRRVLAEVGSYSIISSAKNKGTLATVFAPLSITSKGDKVTLVFWINSTRVGMTRPTNDTYTEKKIVFGKGGKLVENTYSRQHTVPRP